MWIWVFVILSPGGAWKNYFKYSYLIIFNIIFWAATVISAHTQSALWCLQKKKKKKKIQIKACTLIGLKTHHLTPNKQGQFSMGYFLKK